VAQHRAFAGGQDGRKPASLGRQASITNGIDASVDPVEAAAREPMLDCAFPEADTAQVFERDKPVLFGGDRRYGTVTTVTSGGRL
jgi:hypothetical protein